MTPHRMGADVESVPGAAAERDAPAPEAVASVTPLLPPGPDLPPWRQVQSWIEDPVGFWEGGAARYGETFTVQLGSLGTTVLFSQPEAVRQIFQLPPERFECRQFNEHYKQVMGERSVLVADGARHKRLRHLLAQALSPQRLEGLGAAIVQEVSRRVLASWPLGAAFAVRPSMHAVSLQVVLQILFGTRYGAIRSAISDLFEAEILPAFGTLSPWARFVHHHAELRERIAEAIAWRRARPEVEGPLLFETLVVARDEEGGHLSDEEIQDQIFTLLIAGVDPSALALSWALYWVLEAPEIQAKLRRELVPLGRDPDPSRLLGLPYLGAVCQESLRMYPVVATPSGRKLRAGATILGRDFGAGTTLLPCTYLVHRRADVYPEPARFRPERFLERHYSKYEYFPFGGGDRYCIGASLALLELKVALATILTHRDLEPAHDGPVRPIRHGTLLAPSASMKLVAQAPV